MNLTNIRYLVSPVVLDDGCLEAVYSRWGVFTHGLALSWLHEDPKSSKSWRNNSDALGANRGRGHSDDTGMVTGRCFRSKRLGVSCWTRGYACLQSVTLQAVLACFQLSSPTISWSYSTLVTFIARPLLVPDKARLGFRFP